MGSFAEMERISEAQLQLRRQEHAIEARTNSAAVQALNDRAELEIWGSRGAPVINQPVEHITLTHEDASSEPEVSNGLTSQSESSQLHGKITWLNPENGEELPYTAGKLAEIAGNPRFGKKQAERQAAADRYLADVEALVESGFELCQAKLIMDLRENDQEKTHSLTGKFMSQGLMADEAQEKAQAFYKKADDLRLKTIREKGVFSKEELDAVRTKRAGKVATTVKPASPPAPTNPEPPESPEPPKPADGPDKPKGPRAPEPPKPPVGPAVPKPDSPEVPDPASTSAPSETEKEVAESDPVEANSLPADISLPEFRRGHSIILTTENGDKYRVEGKNVIRIDHETGEEIRVAELGDDADLADIKIGQRWSINGDNEEGEIAQHLSSSPVVGVDIEETPVAGANSNESEPTETVQPTEVDGVPVPTTKKGWRHHVKNVMRQAGKYTGVSRAGMFGKDSGRYIGSKWHEAGGKKRKAIVSSIAALALFGAIFGPIEATSGSSSNPPKIEQTAKSHSDKSADTTTVTRPNVSKDSVPPVSYGPNSASISLSSK